MGICTKRTQKMAKPSIIQLSLKSGKYQLLCFPKISSAALCGFVPSIFLLVQIKLNTGGNANTQTAMHEHTGKLYEIRGRAVYMKKASVIYCTQARLHPLHTHGKPLPNPLPLTREQQSVIRRSSDCFPHNRRPAADLMPLLGASGRAVYLSLPHRWLAGPLPEQKTDMKDSACEGVTLRRKAHTPALAHVHTKGRIIPLAT